MPARRLSRGTPYILTTTEIQQLIDSLTPRQEEAIAQIVGLTLSAWRKQGAAKKAHQVANYLNTAQISAAVAAAAKANADLEAAAFVITEAAEVDNLAHKVQALEKKVQQLAKPKPEVTQ
jgi:ubiquinone biosynthesis protein UbiJ